jgi:anaerobic selenocysteine-containing dehydrogenase
MYHYGRAKASSGKVCGGLFKSYGTGTIGNHTSVCEGGKWSAQEMTWGGHFDNWDFDKTNYVLNFGSNCLETHTNHIPVSHRLIRAVVDRKVPLVTFDVRLSNTAAKGREWVPITPGGDCAVLLAMCNEVVQNGWIDKDFLKFMHVTKNIKASNDEKIAGLKKHLKGYTADWAAKESGVSASKIKQIAKEFATTKPACLVTYRGAIAHYNGNEAERAAQLLSGLTGNTDVPGGRCKAVGAGWKGLKIPKERGSKKLKIVDGFKGEAAYPTHHVSHQVWNMIKDGKAGRPEMYVQYCYTPGYANGDNSGTRAIMADESIVPYYVASDVCYGDSSHYADLILPDTFYTERYDWEDMVDPNQIGEYYIRQAMTKPPGEVKNFADVCCDLAKKLDLGWSFSSMEEDVKKSVDQTPGVKEAGGWKMMQKEGVWNAGNKPRYRIYEKEIPESKYKAKGVILDEETGVYWKPKGDASKGYSWTKGAYKGYVGTLIDGKVYQGFPPDKINRSGHLTIYSVHLEKKGFNPLPVYEKAPEHEKMGKDDMIMTTFKVAVQSHSRTQNCMYLSEQYHNNAAWISSKDAAARGIKDGDKIKVKAQAPDPKSMAILSGSGEIVTKARVTERIMPGVIAISHHRGHIEYGRYASGKKAPAAGGAHDNDPFLKTMWWDDHGVHPNNAIPNWSDPRNGQMRWMDTVVKVTKA